MKSTGSGVSSSTTMPISTSFRKAWSLWRASSWANPSSPPTIYLASTRALESASRTSTPDGEVDPRSLPRPVRCLANPPQPGRPLAGRGRRRERRLAKAHQATSLADLHRARAQAGRSHPVLRQQPVALSAPNGRRRADGFCNLLFFHYCPTGMSDILQPENWPSLFGLPELASVVELSPAPAR